ncbi:hypothetical protein DFQ27_009808 [Actinomortierella ambigua]|uniref:Uncharacterized protein n=1 Tax=Actinomortierella ambigua TaxID=1343610 RepID=A0A9P6PPK4_9FUNG|nr:hypothetical protein DFQ27_009808 [Actinomortierella ambigua]
MSVRLIQLLASTPVLVLLIATGACLWAASRRAKAELDYAVSTTASSVAAASGSSTRKRRHSIYTRLVNEVPLVSESDNFIQPKATEIKYRTIALAVLNLIPIVYCTYGLVLALESSTDEDQSLLRRIYVPAVSLLGWLIAELLVLALLTRRLEHATGLKPLQWFFSAALAVMLYSLWIRIDALLEYTWGADEYIFVTVLVTVLTIFATGITMPAELDFDYVLRHGYNYQNETHERSPEATASFWSWLWFSWFTPLIKMGSSKTLDATDLPEIVPQLRARSAYGLFHNMRATGSLFRRILLFNLTSFTWQFCCVVLATFLDFATPFFLKRFLIEVDTPSKEPKWAYLYIVLIFVSQVLRSLIQSQMFYLGRRINVNLISTLNAEIYAKTLTRRDMSGLVDKKDKDGEAKGKETGTENAGAASTGKIVNLMSTDTVRVAGVVNFAHMAVSSPIGIIVGTYLLYDLLGWSSLVGMGVLVISMPINKKVRAYYIKSQRELSAARDERVTLVGELIQGIRMIKFFAWEMSFSDKCMKAREIELKKLIHVYKTIIVFQLVWYLSPLMVTLLTFFCYTKIHNGQFTPAVAFTAMVLFGRLKGPLNGLPAVYMALANASVSLNRIAEYLHEPNIQDKFANGESENAPVIGMKDLTAQWWTTQDASGADLTLSNRGEEQEEEEPLDRAEDRDRFALRNINVSFPVGEMSIICGPTGSGKSSLLMALLGEMDVLTGKIYLPRRAAGSRELDPATGLMKDGVAYVSQQAWLQNATIRNNILFGSPYEEERYNEVIRVCALERDFEIFEDGDKTEIGEKGITLSGGQKQRVSLARAIYSRARHVLLDDCLSAVDAHTAEHIYSQCLTGPIMEHRTCILVTHHVRLCIPTAKLLVAMDNGVIEIQGSVQELRDAGVLSRIMDEEEEHATAGHSSDDETVAEDEDLGAASNLAKPDLARRRSSLDKKRTNQEQIPAAAAAAATAAAKDAKKLVQDETRQEGSVKWEIYKIYLNAVGGIPFWLFLLCSFAVVRLINIAENLWVREWTNSYTDSSFMRFMTTSIYSSYGMSTSQHAFSNPPSGAPDYNNAGYGHSLDNNNNITEFSLLGPKHSTNYYLAIYALVSVVGSLAHIGNTVICLYGSLRAARFLYKKLLYSVVRAPLRFFDTTPVGRIMNRFGNDFETVDSTISNTFSNSLELTMSIISIFVLLTLITPMFIVVAAIISVAYIYVGRLYINTSRELKRLHSVSRSPIYSLFGETLAGVSIVRAFGAQGRFMGDLLTTIDNSNRPFYYLWIANRWLSVRSDSIGAIVTLSSGLFILMNPVAIDAGTVGLALTYALEFVNLVNMLTREYTQLEVDLNSVERITEYSVMPQEPPAIIEGRRPPAAWPTGGSIEVKNLEIKYAPDLDTVIRGISFDVKPGEKVGVVGRTGSGKSTLALSLFRFVEPTAGSIHIDGIDICDIGLDDLRSRLTIIPQDPMLFKGTIRSNLDPFGNHEDAELWETLRRVHLIGPTVHASGSGSHHSNNVDTAVSSSANSVHDEASAAGGSGTATPVVGASQSGGPGAHVSFSSLDNPVSEGGTNFSQGQRQLLCMARALLRNTKISIMDEATASVDFASDAKIQKTIREEFSNSTLICIAHRLRTIITYDRVLVLDHGEIKEYDTPANLLLGKGWDSSKLAASSSANVTDYVGEEKTQFREMCERSGELQVLCELVRDAEAKKKASDY